MASEKQRQKQKCVNCEEEKNAEEMTIGGKGTEYAGKPVCDSCFYDAEAEPEAQVFYGTSKEPNYITPFENQTDGDFKVRWHPTDAWRGYYDVSSSKYTNLNSDAILSYDESEVKLNKFDDKVQELFKKNKIDYARVFTRTSNLFSTGYDLYVKKGQVDKAKKLVDKAKGEVGYS